MRIEIRLENRRFVIPIPTALIVLAGRFSKDIPLKGAQGRVLLRELKKGKAVLANEPLVEYESADSSAKVVIRL